MNSSISSSSSASSSSSSSQISEENKIFTTSSKFFGVTWDKRFDRWLARITINGQKKEIGSYSYEKDAVEAYDEIAVIAGKPTNFLGTSQVKRNQRVKV